MQIHNKTILIAGASTGIGRALALELARHDNTVVVTARSLDKLTSLVEEIELEGGKALAIAADAMIEAEALSVIETAVVRFEKIDIAILNIGGGPVMNMAHISTEEVLQNMRFNYDTFVHYLIPLIDHMKSFNEGMIVHTNSLAGFLGLPMQGPYSAAKSAARILMDTCRIELRKHHLKFVSVHPGFVKTERQLAYDQPMPVALSEEQAVKQVIKAMRRQSWDHLFPFSYRVLIRLAGFLPKRLTSWILKWDLPEDYG